MTVSEQREDQIEGQRISLATFVSSRVMIYYMRPGHLQFVKQNLQFAGSYSCEIIEYGGHSISI